MLLPSLGQGPAGARHPSRAQPAMDTDRDGQASDSCSGTTCPERGLARRQRAGRSSVTFPPGILGDNEQMQLSCVHDMHAHTHVGTHVHTHTWGGRAGVPWLWVQVLPALSLRKATPPPRWVGGQDLVESCQDMEH